MKISLREREIAERSAIVTTVHYDLSNEAHRTREATALKTLYEAAERGYTTVVVHDQVSDTFFTRASDLCTLIEDKRKGMGSSRRQGFEYAEKVGKDVINWTEPEKDDYVRFVYMVCEPILQDRADVVIPTRTVTSQESYPQEQLVLEHIQNRAIRRAIREYLGIDVELDLTFGPRAWHRGQNNLFTRYGGEFGDTYDSINIPVIQALAAQKRVIPIEVDFIYPQNQRQSECIYNSFDELRIEMLEKRLVQTGTTPVQVLRFLESFKRAP